jgi:hypothetical protein
MQGRRAVRVRVDLQQGTCSNSKQGGNASRRQKEDDSPQGTKELLGWRANKGDLPGSILMAWAVGD